MCGVGKVAEWDRPAPAQRAPCSGPGERPCIPRTEVRRRARRVEALQAEAGGDHSPHMQTRLPLAVAAGPGGLLGSNVTTALPGPRGVPAPAQTLLCQPGFGSQLPQSGSGCHSHLPPCLCSPQRGPGRPRRCGLRTGRGCAETQPRGPHLGHFAAVSQCLVPGGCSATVSNE